MGFQVSEAWAQKGFGAGKGRRNGAFVARKVFLAWGRGKLAAATAAAGLSRGGVLIVAFKPLTDLLIIVFLLVAEFNVTTARTVIEHSISPSFTTAIRLKQNAWALLLISARNVDWLSLKNYHFLTSKYNYQFYQPSYHMRVIYSKDIDLFPQSYTIDFNFICFLPYCCYLLLLLFHLKQEQIEYIG